MVLIDITVWLTFRARIIKEETGEKDLKGTESSSTTHDFQLLGSDESNGSNPHGDGIFRMYQVR